MKRLLFALIILILISLTTCQKEVIESQDYPRIKTLEVTNISNMGATFNAKILSEGNSPNIEYGFTWDTIPDPHPFSSEKIEKQQTIGKGKFEFTINSSLLKERRYFVKAYVKTKNHFVLGQAVQFLSRGSLPPVISSIEPQVASWGDTINLKGEGFSSRSNEVFFGTLPGEVIYHSDSLVKAIVPSEENELAVKIIVNSGTSEVSSSGVFTYISPTINEFTPKSGSFGDEISISGANFMKNKGLKVTFNGKTANITEASNAELIVQVPPEANQKELEICVSVNGITDCYPHKFTVNAPFGERISHRKAETGQSIFIEGRNFNPINTNNTVYFDDLAAIPQNASNSRLEVKVPEGIYITRDIKIRIETAEQKQVMNSGLYISDVWLNKGKIPDNDYPQSAVYSFSHEQYGYCAFGTNNTIYCYRYDPATNQWSEMGKFPGSYRFHMTVFVIEDFAYIGGFNNNKDFWKYDILNNSWEQIADFPENNEGLTAFALNGKGYAISTESRENNFWMYDPNSDTWQQIDDFTTDNWWHAYADINFVHNNKAYILTSDGTTAKDELWEYNPVSDTWTRLADQIDNLFYSKRCVFVLGNNAYLMSDGHYPYLCKYDILNNKWTIIDNANGVRNGVCFTINDVAYIQGDPDKNNSSNNFWEYNPNP
ncbi:IPT/TIG domain-containing protein [Marinilabilia salmonicolor]|uniref:IPT/TIG domain-containing protein n=1 Tax=Marinilabilia salmonicolor TaxID=989 RepID=UPI00029AE13A|nr:IPT/TIG domain-containing protein [Marinilabilia salmonicolor]